MLALMLAIDSISPAAYSDCCNTTAADRRSNATWAAVHHTHCIVPFLSLDGVITAGSVDAEY